MTDTISSVFLEAVKRNPHGRAILETGRSLTFQELSDMAGRIASCIPDGVRTVGIVMRHRAEMIAAMLAAARRGCTYVPAEPAFPTERIRYMMSSAGADVVLTDKEHVPRLEGFANRIVDCEVCTRSGELPKGDGPGRPDDVAYVLYTSGTTGQPKGVRVTNANVIHYVRAFRHEFDVGPGDIMLQNSVCTFDIFVEEVFCSLLNGAALAIPSEEEKGELRSLMEFAERHGVTIISGFPYLLADMNHLERLPSDIRLLISGGDVLRSSYVNHLVDEVTVYNTYGPSETTVCAAYYNCTQGAPLEDGTYPLGHAVEGARISILDESGAEVPPGIAGEICIFGDGVSQGYLGAGSSENAAFTETEQGPMYRTGDFGYVLSSGDIAFLHRKDTQIMIYGQRVELSEVEAAFYRCSGIAQAVVRAFSDDQGLPYMIAYIVPARPFSVLSHLRGELAEFLPPYMIPEYIVKMHQIPLNSNGKPDVSRLPVVLKDG